MDKREEIIDIVCAITPEKWEGVGKDEPVWRTEINRNFVYLYPKTEKEATFFTIRSVGFYNPAKLNILAENIYMFYLNKKQESEVIEVEKIYNLLTK